MKECPKCNSADMVLMKQAGLYACQTCHKAFHLDGRMFVATEKPVFNKASGHAHEGMQRAMEHHKVSPAEAAMIQATIFELVSDGYKNGFREGLLLGTKQTIYNLTVKGETGSEG